MPLRNSAHELEKLLQMMLPRDSKLSQVLYDTAKIRAWGKKESYRIRGGDSSITSFACSFIKWTLPTLNFLTLNKRYTLSQHGGWDHSISRHLSETAVNLTKELSISVLENWRSTTFKIKWEWRFLWQQPLSINEYIFKYDARVHWPGRKNFTASTIQHTTGHANNAANTMILNCLALHLEGLKIAFKVDEKFAKKSGD